MDPTGFYDGLAERYHLIFMDWAASRERQGGILDGLIRAALGEGSKEVLDASCGIGTQALGLAARGHRVFASDISPASIARAEHEATAAGLKLAGSAVADMRTLSEQISQRFDMVLSCDNALPHLLKDSELAAAAHHLHTVLNPGGLLIATIRDYDAIEPKPGAAVPTEMRAPRRRRVPGASPSRCGPGPLMAGATRWSCSFSSLKARAGAPRASAPATAHSSVKS